MDRRDKEKRAAQGSTGWYESETRRERTAVRAPDKAGEFKLAKASHRLAVVPYRVGAGNPSADEGELWWCRVYHVHTKVGGDGIYVCPERTAHARCPICEHFAQLRDQRAWDEIKHLQAKPRMLVNVLDLDDPKKGVQVWDVTLNRSFPEEIYKDQKEDDLKGNPQGLDEFWKASTKGKNLELRVEDKPLGDKGGKTWKAVTRVTYQPRKEALSEKILKQAVCLDELLIDVSYQELKKIYHRTDAEPADEADELRGQDQDDEEAPPRRRARKDDSDDEEESPQRKKKSSGFQEGDYVTYQNRECEVVHVSGDGTSLRLKLESGKVIKAVDPDDCTPVAVADAAEEETPKRKRAKNKKPPQAREGLDDDEIDSDEDDDLDDDDEEELDDDLDEDFDDDEDGDEIDDDDDDEEDDEEDEDDDEEPASRRKEKGERKSKRR